MILYGGAIMKCPKCKKLVKSLHQFFILDPPNCLFVTLKRFKREGHIARKNTKSIKNNISLDLNDFVLHESNKPTSCLYRLVGFTSHGGSLGGGHYTAYVQNNGKYLYHTDGIIFQTHIIL